MRLIAKFVKALDVISGETERGTWCRGGMVVRTLDDREQLVAFTAFGEEKCNACAALKIDDIIQVSFQPESREFGEKWFTDLRLISVHLVGAGVGDQTQKGAEQIWNGR